MSTAQHGRSETFEASPKSCAGRGSGACIKFFVIEMRVQIRIASYTLAQCWDAPFASPNSGPKCIGNVYPKFYEMHPKFASEMCIRNFMTCIWKAYPKCFPKCVSEIFPKCIQNFSEICIRNFMKEMSSKLTRVSEILGSFLGCFLACSGVHLGHVAGTVLWDSLQNTFWDSFWHVYPKFLGCFLRTLFGMATTLALPSGSACTCKEILETLECSCRYRSTTACEGNVVLFLCVRFGLI